MKEEVEVLIRLSQYSFNYCLGWHSIFILRRKHGDWLLPRQSRISHYRRFREALRSLSCILPTVFLFVQQVTELLSFPWQHAVVAQLEKNIFYFIRFMRSWNSL